MQVNLKQTEIEKALTQHLENSGISLYAKAVSIKFTAGRKGSGLSADISIDDVAFPTIGEQTPQPAPLVLVTQVPAVTTETPVEAAEPVSQPAPEVTPKSLFG